MLNAVLFSWAAACLPAEPAANPIAPAVVVVAPQGNSSSALRTPQGPAPLPSGGTPEPTVMLLLAGSALAYGGVRLKRSRQQSRGD